MADSKIKFKYIGREAFLNGIPARDLTEEDWAGLDRDQQMMVKASSLYKEVGAEARKTPPVKAEADQEETEE